jgi:hypothetical protein
MKTKMDDIGITAAVDKLSTGSKAVGGYIYNKAKAATESVNSKIDSNPKLSGAKSKTKEKLGVLSNGMKSSWTSLSSKFYKQKVEEHKE